MKARKPPTLKALRELAKKHLKKGYSKLSRPELVERLKAYVPALRDVSAAVATKRRTPATPTKAKATTKRSAGTKETTPARKVARAAAPRGAAKAPPTKKGNGPRGRTLKKAPAVAEPVSEGFFVARIAGEDEARRHAPVMAARPASPADDPEQLGALPERYDDDDTVLLPRDPETLFVFWSHREGTREEAARGLDRPRAVLKVFDGERVVREVDFAFESGRFYIHGLPPGRAYRVEAFFVGRDGRSRRVGIATNVVDLPRKGPSPDRRVRFARLPWNAHPTSLRRLLREGGVQLRMVAQSVLDVTRLGMPGSMGLHPWGSSGGWAPPSSSGLGQLSRQG